MADIEVNKASWDALSSKSQQTVTDQLRKHGILGSGDSIVTSDNVPERAADSAPMFVETYGSRDCYDLCDYEATMAFEACVSSGTSPSQCAAIAKSIFTDCIQGCEDEEDVDDGDDDEDEDDS